VLLFAPDSAYGPPDALKRLIDEAHGRELMMILDVVYNHLGPSGNYLHCYAPDFFTERHKTPWGQALNFAAPQGYPVRDFIIENALYWLLEYRFVGLRFYAVHAIYDNSQPYIVEEIAAQVRTQVGGSRHVHLILENDNNAPRYLTRDDEGCPRHCIAQWNDDFHHAAHVIATGETYGYYTDYAEAPIGSLARVLAEGFAYQGQPSRHRSGARRGEPSAGLPPTAFVSFIQNHDQIGNRAFGERLAVLVTGDLARAVREGRQREFAKSHDRAGATAARPIPDPNQPDTFARSSLDWREGESAKGRRHLELVRHLLALRRSVIVPLLAGMAGNSGSYEAHAEQALRVRWQLGDGSRLTLIANLSPRPTGRVDWALDGDILHAQPADWSVADPVRSLPPWAVGFALDSARRPP
jgi:1,4-alpha-glucan branching enzyme